jgi:rRNA pseudouridine-1189 N-methylase Emg1 (Nep1/Mra1 family)
MTRQNPSLRGYLRWEAAYVVLRERGEPMTTAELVEELLARGRLFFGQFPEASLQQS